MAQKFKNRNKLKLLLWQKESLYKSWWFHKFISKLMFNGKKFCVEKKLYVAINNLKKTHKKIPFYLFMHFFEKIKPFMLTITKRLGRKFYLVPIPISLKRQYIVGLNWIVQAIKAQKQLNLSVKITTELNDVFSNKKSNLWKKKNQAIRTITEARVYSRYRWM